MIDEAASPVYQASDVALYHGDCRAVLAGLPVESVDCCVTSPPYLGLRAYDGVEPVVWGGSPECEHDWQARSYLVYNSASQRSSESWSDAGEANAERLRRGRARRDSVCSKCGAWRGCLGMEPTVEMFVDHLTMIFREVRRILKPSGSCWVNLGDSYSGNGAGNLKPRTEHGNGGGAMHIPNQRHFDARWMDAKKPPPGLAAKQLCLIPYRFALAAQADGWWVREDVIWAKTACMPEAVTDRCTRSHEYIYHLTKQPRYYHNADALKEPASENTHSRGRGIGPKGESMLFGEGVKNNSDSAYAIHGRVSHRNARSVWTIGPEPLAHAHYAAFPTEIPRRVILASCPPGGVVLDPFVGSGTTMLVARQLGRKGIGIDASRHYLETIAIPRISGQTPALPLEV